MKNFLKSFNLFIVLSLFFYNFSAKALTLSVQAYDTSGNIIVNNQVNNISTITNLGKIVFTFTGISNFSFTDSNSGPAYAQNWGIYFGSTSGVSCSVATPCQTNSTADGVTLTIDNSQIPTVTGNSSPYIANGNLSVTLSFTTSTPTANQFPQDIKNLIASNSLNVGILYQPSSGPISYYSPMVTWQPDKGSLLNAPTFNVIAQDGAFQISSLSAPSDTTAVCPSSDGTTCKASNDGSSATTLISTSNNSISGFVIGYWKDSDCKIGGFNFSPNWNAYNYSSPITSYNCTYTPWQNSFNTGGNSSTLNCPSSAVTFFNGSASPTIDSAAIPYISSNPKADLQSLINNPGIEYTNSTNSSCIRYVYVPASRSSWTKTGIINGDIYGVTAWALNSALDPTYNIPNYSLAHSNIYYITSVIFQLASSNKNSGLSKNTDCFVVTAASGNENSKAVFYWRILRDSYLTPLGITPFYYKHAKVWASWLEKHPQLKPPLNFIFEKTGYTFYHLGEFLKNFSKNTKENLDKLLHNFKNLLDNSAHAQVRPNDSLYNQKIVAFREIPNESTQKNNKAGFGFDLEGNQQNINVVPEDMENDPFFNNISSMRENIKPNYEISLLGGILMPTQDKKYYDRYYSSQPSLSFVGGVSRLFWKNNVGFSLGIQGRYLTNTQEDSISVLGNTNQKYTRTFYAVSSEITGGIRYRNPSFLYIQPGIFIGGGVTRFREQAKAEGSASSNTSGVTEWSGIYEAGTNIDISLSELSGQNYIDKGDLLNEVLLRLSASYNVNPSNALSSTGFFFHAGFIFLMN